MITRFLSRLREGAKRRSSGRGQGTRVSSPAAAGSGTRVRPVGREQVERETASNWYWSSTTNANNPNNAWNVNFNNGNVNNNDKNNDKHVRAVRGGSWSALTSTRSVSCGGSTATAAATSGTR